MTLDEAIKKYISNAEYERTHGSLQGCLDFRQLAEWLKDLKQLREQTRWIPVSERLPEIVEWYLTSIKWDDGTERVTISWFDGMSFKAEVIAYMPLPQPYKAESEVQDANSN